jgi:hypothetical protein
MSIMVSIALIAGKVKGRKTVKGAFFQKRKPSEKDPFRGLFNR